MESVPFPREYPYSRVLDEIARVTNGTSLATLPARESTLEALRTGRSAGMRTVFDVDYRQSSWVSPEEAGRVARAALGWADIVLGNEEELSLLTVHDGDAVLVRDGYHPVVAGHGYNVYYLN